MFDLSQHPHRRFNPLIREWVVVSPHRLQRPWQGQVETTAADARPTYDPACYLCPGNERSGGEINPAYTSTFVFQNDFSALLPDTPPGDVDHGGLIRAEAVQGLCKVVCFSPRHDLTMAEMSVDEIAQVVATWTTEYEELGHNPAIQYVQIFENRGAMMGASNPHPHGQIWGTGFVPVAAAHEDAAQRDHYAAHGTTLLADYLALETAAGTRLVCENDGFVAVVPFWAAWPFETLVISRRPVAALPDLTAAEQTALADILKQVTTRYDNVFGVSFPYSMGLHQRPTDDGDYGHWHFHAHFYPPLLRSATIRKFMVGFEMLGEPQRDLTAESAAERLRAQSPVHYRQRG